MYDEAKRYQMLVHQQGVPWVEADENDRNWIFYNLLRRFIQKIVGNGSPDDGFKVVGTGTANDFIITGGDGTPDDAALEGAGRLLVEGFQCVLPESRNYRGSDNLECTPVSTDLAETVLTDSAANFTLGGPDDNLAGRTLAPDITQPDKAYTITANTQTTITISGDLLADGIQVGAHYRIELSTPTADRTDEVYIDCYLDEIDSDEDPGLKHTLGIQIETQRRLKLIQNVFVTEGSATPAPYTDSDDNQHYTCKLATIQRYAGQAVINPQDITDERPILDGGFWNLWQEVVAARGVMPSLDARLDVSLNEDGTLKAGHADLSDMPDTPGSNPDHDARYVKKAGDTMTGNLGMAAGKTVDGRDVSEDGAKLDTIETGATQDQTPQEILGAIKTVDGHESGLDADTVDGVHSSDYLDNVEAKIYKVQGGINVLTLLSGVTFSDSTPVSSLSQVRVFISPADAGHDVGLNASYNKDTGAISSNYGAMALCLLKKNGWNVDGTTFSWNFNNYT